MQPHLVIQGPFFSYDRLAFLESVSGSLLIGECGQSHVRLRMAEITSVSSFEPNVPTEQKLGYVYELQGVKMISRRKHGPKKVNHEND